VVKTKKKTRHSSVFSSILAIRDERLHQLVYLLRLLGLTPPLRAYDVRAHAGPGARRCRPFAPHEAGLLGVLEVVPVRLGQAPVDGGLHPHDLVDQPGKEERERERET